MKRYLQLLTLLSLMLSIFSMSFADNQQTPVSTYPFLDSFEEGLQEWTHYTESWAEEYWTTGHYSPRTGSRSAVLQSLHTNSVSAWIMRPFYMEAGQSYDVELWVMHYDSDFPDFDYSSLSICYGTDGTIDAMNSQIQSCYNITSNYQEVRGRVCPQSSGVYWIGIYGETGNHSYLHMYSGAIVIDDFMVKHTSEAPVFTYTPGNINFGAVIVNTDTSYANITVTNFGLDAIELTTADICIIGTDAAMFEYDANSLPLLLSIEQSGNIGVRYQPTAQGVHNATLRMVHNGTNYDVALRGKAVGENALMGISMGSQFPNTGWIEFAEDGYNGETWHSGSISSECYEYPDYARSWLITPKLAPTAENHTFDFSACVDLYFTPPDPSYPYHTPPYYSAEILVSTGNGELESFSSFWHLDIGESQYLFNSIDLSQFIGQHIFIAIRAMICNANLMIDGVSGPDIVVGVPSAPLFRCPKDNRTMVSRTPTFSWNRGPGSAPTGYKVYCDTNNPPVTEVGEVTSTYFYLQDELEPCTVYYWTLRGYNDDGLGEAATACRFTTAPVEWVSIGSGATYNDRYSYPAVYGGCEEAAREQYIVTATELTASGAQAGLISSIAFDVHNPNIYRKILDFTISIGQTSATEFTDNNFLTGLTEIYAISNFFPSEGCNAHGFSTPFFWDGASNIVIQTNHELIEYWDDSGQFQNASTYYTIDESACRAIYRSGYGYVGFDTGTRCYNRPNIMLYIESAQITDIVANQEYPVDNMPGVTFTSSHDLNIVDGVDENTGVIASLTNLDPTNAFISGYSCTESDVTLTFAITEAGTYYLMGYWNGAWHQGTPWPLVVPPNSSVTLNGIDFTAKGDVYVVLTRGQDPTLPVELSSFSAALTSQNYVKLTWISQTETGMWGYRVYRGESEDQATTILLTPVLIPATNTSTTQEYNLEDKEVEIGNTYWYWLEAVEVTGAGQFYGQPVSVIVTGEVPPVLPTVTTMGNAYPNPFKRANSTTIDVSIKAGESGTVTIYNILGQVVKTFKVNEGMHKLNWNGEDTRGNNCGSGIYFYKLSTPNTNMTKKLIFIK